MLPIVIVILYASFNLIYTEPLDSLSTICDPFTTYASNKKQNNNENLSSDDDADAPLERKLTIPPIADMDLITVNRLLHQNPFNHANRAERQEPVH